MKKVLLSLAAVTALAAAAAPASAQTYGYDSNPAREAERLERRIERAEMNGRLTRREADRLHGQLREIERVSWRYRQDGRLTQWERNDLDRRYSALEGRLRFERNDRDYGYGYRR